MLNLVLGLALASPAGLFGPLDDDGDGVDDMHDDCLSLPETRNRYADDDGCPDYLANVRLEATYGGERLDAEWYGVNDGTGWEASWSEPSVPFVPGQVLTVAATRDCLQGQAVTTLRDSTTLRLDLMPVWDRTIDLEIRDASGTLVPDASIEWLGVSTPGCAPESVGLLEGQATMKIGEGEHLVRISAPGFASEVASLSVGDDALHSVLWKVTLAPRPRFVDALGRVHFATDQATLDAPARAALDEVAAWLRDHPDATPEVVLEGHADERGSHAYNRGLSLDRARAVRRYLADKGVRTADVVLVPRGETDPMAEGSGTRAWAINRRVEVKVEPAVADAEPLDADEDTIVR